MSAPLTARTGASVSSRAASVSPSGPRAALPASVHQVLRTAHFLRLPGAAGRGDARALALAHVPVEVIQGALSAGRPLVFSFRSNGDEVEVGIGSVSRPGAELLARATAAAIGGADPATGLRGEVLRGSPRMGALLGMPRGAEASALVASGESVADRLLGAMNGASFELLVTAEPEPAADIGLRLTALREQAERLDREYLAMPQQANLHRGALRQRQWLDRMIERLERALGAGIWRTVVCIGAGTEDAVLQCLGTLAGSLTELTAEPLLPLAPVLCGREEGAVPLSPSSLTSSELAALLVLPSRDRAGFTLRPTVAFDLDHTLAETDSLSLGMVVDGDRSTHRSFAIAPDLLTRHAFVAGQTGSGKTTFVKRLVSELARTEIPFLILEPAKGEYAELAASVKNLVVLDVGRAVAAGGAAFRMNPFAFPVGFSLHTHVDLLKSAFTASFGLVPPGPYLLEAAIYRAYEHAGWSIETGEHRTGSDPLAFPTLSDLLGAIDLVVAAAGYDAEVSRNLRGALRTRIGNLCLGPKGMALDVVHGLPDTLLFDQPVVLELRHLGSDAEKAFVMSLVLMRLYEYRDARPQRFAAAGLRHLLVLEEAHRLLRRQTERAAEEGNMALEAVRTFENLISEVRAYGQGILLVDQLPSTISPGALKQTSTRVVHRLLPREDRVAVGDVLTPAQIDALAILPAGDAVVHVEGMDGAVRIRVPRSEVLEASAAPRALTAEAARALLGDELTARFQRETHRKLAAPLLRDSRLAECTNRLVASVASEASALSAWKELEAVAGEGVENASRPVGLSPEDLAACALEAAIIRRARHYGWTTAEVETITGCIGGPIELVAEALLSRLQTGRGRFAWCAHCPMPCRFGYEGKGLALRDGLADALPRAEDPDGSTWIERMTRLVGSEIEALLPEGAPVPAAFRRCVIGHLLRNQGVSSDRIASIVEEVSDESVRSES